MTGASRPRLLLLANPRGFCAGVVRAIAAVEQAIAAFGSPVYVRRAIVHNATVVGRLERMGAIFVQDLADVPSGAVTILSAHGVAPHVRADARRRGLRLLDATCPLVERVHGDVIAHHRAGRAILLIGHADHAEMTGTLGHVPPGAAMVLTCPADVDALSLPGDTPVAYAVQTTFSVQDSHGVIAAIRARFADVAGPRAANICYATTNRQAAVAAIAPRVEHMFVVGDPASSNANRLVEVARASGNCMAHLVRDAGDIDWAAMADAGMAGLTAAASTPESAVQSVCAALRSRGFTPVECEGVVERAVFRPVSMDFAS